jgi:hypothetical protein
MSPNMRMSGLAVDKVPVVELRRAAPPCQCEMEHLPRAN